jgi:hypothetical protein
MNDPLNLLSPAGTWDDINQRVRAGETESLQERLRILQEELAAEKRPEHVAGLKREIQSTQNKIGTPTVQKANYSLPIEQKGADADPLGLLSGDDPLGLMGSEKKPTLGESAVGTLETLGHLVTGLPAGLAGGFNFMATLAGTGGDVDAAMAVKKGSEETINSYLQYDPKTKAGKDIAQIFGEGMHDLNKMGGDVGAAFGKVTDKMGNGNFIAGGPGEEAGRAIGEAGTEMLMNVLPFEGLFTARPKGINHAADAAQKLKAMEEVKASSPETPLPELNMEGVPPRLPETVVDTPLPELNMWDGTQTEGFPKINGDIEGAAPIKNAVPPRLEDPLGAEAKARREQADIEARFQNQEDFNNGTLDNGLTEKFAKAQEEFQALQEKVTKEQAKEAAWRMAEEQKVIDLNKMEIERQLDIARKAGELDFMELQRGGDKSLMNERATGFLFDAIHEGSLGKALHTIAGMHERSGYRTLARYLEDKIQSLKVKLHNDGVILAGERAYTGYFDSASNTVGFSRQGALSPHTVLHEVVHALTSQFLHLKPDHFLSKGIKGIYQQVSKKPGFEKFKSIINEREFLAEAFSNPEFQKFLKQMHVSPNGALRTAWNKFMHNVKNMLGIKQGPLSDALYETIDLGKRVMESSNEKFRNKAKDKLAAEGIPNKMLDLMASKKQPVVATNKSVEPYKKLPGLKHAVEDFAFGPEKPEAVLELARSAEDIPTGVVEKMGQQLQAGGLFESLKTRNPVVKYTYERLTRAAQESADMIRTNLTDAQTGLKSFMRDLNAAAKAEIWMQMMKDEGHKLRTADDLAKAGYSEAQIAFYQRYRELDKRFLDSINEVRTEIGMQPIDERVAHMAGRFMGPFSQMGFLNGKVVAPIHATTRWELNKAVKWMKENHPEYEWGKVEYKEIGKGKSASDRFGGLMEAINMIEKADGNVKTLMDSYREYIKSDASNIFNARRHELPKAETPGGRQGSEGNKPWESAVKNAKQGMKAQLEYFEQGYTWMAMQKAVDDLKMVLGDESIKDSQRNALEWSNMYLDHALGRNQGALADAAGALLSYVGKHSFLLPIGDGWGVGHTNIIKASNKAKQLMMQKFMGFFNFPFTVTQLMQPLQTHPAMLTLLKSRGMETHIAKSQVAATETYLHSMWNKDLGDVAALPKLDAFSKSAIEYANKNGIFDVKLSDHLKDINTSHVKETFDRVADYNITAPEHLTRGTAFFFYAHLLKEAGIPAKDVLGAAENMTNFTMTNYHHFERPMMYSGLGWMGDLAATLTRYKHNQLSQATFYAREGIREGRQGNVAASAPLAMFLGAALAFGGIYGMFAYNEADAVYQLFSKHVLGKPDTLFNVINTEAKVPEALSHGMFAALGVDMSSRFSHAKTIPENPAQFLLPYGSAMWDMGATAVDLAKNPTSETAQKRAVKAWAPQSAQGLVENKLWTEKQEDGSNLYINPRTLEGKTTRTDEEMKWRNWGIRGMRESREIAGNYSDHLIKTHNKELADKVIDRAERLYAEGKMTPEKAQELAKEYVQYEGSGDGFGNRMSQFQINRRTTELKRQFLYGNVQDKQRAKQRLDATK